MPVAYGHQDVWVRGYVDKVVIGCRGEIIAHHPRSWEREDVVGERPFFEPGQPRTPTKIVEQQTINPGGKP